MNCFVLVFLIVCFVVLLMVMILFMFLFLYGIEVMCVWVLGVIGVVDLGVVDNVVCVIGIVCVCCGVGECVIDMGVSVIVSIVCVFWWDVGDDDDDNDDGDVL